MSLADSTGTERGPEGTERHAALHRNYANSKQDGSRTLPVAGNMGTEIYVQCAKMLQVAGNMGTENCFQCAKMLQVAGNMVRHMLSVFKNYANNKHHGYCLENTWSPMNP